MIRGGRRRAGFAALGCLGADRIGLSAARGRELLLAHAWRQVAGEAIARRVRPLRLSRGVLELEAVDGAWADSLIPLLPRLAGRLAARHPALRIRRFRLLRKETAPSIPVEADPSAGTPPPSAPAASIEVPPGGGTSAPSPRGVMRRYLDRTAGRLTGRSTR